MVKEIKIVVGLNYGDEGKGLVTNYLSHQSRMTGKKTVNILTNGSCQRGHTVDINEGTKHVFKHFGSGTFQGVDTYFPQEFLVNPIFFNKEYDELDCGKMGTQCLCNENCTIVTPFHMLFNQLKESMRGENKHGSCGMGVWETVRLPLLKVRDLSDKEKRVDILLNIMSVIWDEFINIEHHKEYEEYERYLISHTMANQFLDDCDLFYKRIKIVNDQYIVNHYDTIIFENGQGLLLDQKLEDKEHLTPSNTDLTNPKRFINNMRLDESIVETCYVTRSYLTRHGNGYLQNECDVSEINQTIYDTTNVWNEWQGSIRYGRLDLNNLPKRIKKFGKTSLFVTHINEYSIPVRLLKEITDTIYVFDNKFINSIHKLDKEN